MASVKLCCTDSSPSLALTLISRSPLKSAGGVPVKAAPSKLSQDGRSDPSAKVALKASSALSTSLKASDGSAKLTAVSSGED